MAMGRGCNYLICFGLVVVSCWWMAHMAWSFSAMDPNRILFNGSNTLAFAQQRNGQKRITSYCFTMAGNFLNQNNNNPPNNKHNKLFFLLPVKFLLFVAIKTYEQMLGMVSRLPSTDINATDCLRPLLINIWS